MAALLIHDQGPFAWLVVMSYLAGAFLVYRAASVADGRERSLWLGTAVALVLLAINKQLDLQTDLTMIGKAVAHREGWYDHWRRPVQGLFLLSIAGAAVGFAVFLSKWLRGAAASAKIAAIGLLILLAFIFARAASFHHLDYWVTLKVAGMRGGWWLELLGIAVISGAAIAYRRGAERAATPERA